MGQAVPVRTDCTAGEVRRFARRAKDGAQAMLAALNAVLVEMREERRQVEAAGSFVDVQQGQERATVQPNAWVEAHAMLSEK